MNLKKWNWMFQVALLLLNAGLFIAWHGFIWDATELTWATDLFQSKLITGLLAAALHLIALITQLILTPRAKERMVFPVHRNPLPGTRAFTKLAFSDDRIDVSRLQRKHGPLPQEPSQQNRLWLQIYEDWKGTPEVSHSHSNWLLFRDLTGMSVVLAVVLSGASIAIKSVFEALPYVLVLIAEYLLLSQIARNVGNRFVVNVLVRESVEIGKERFGGPNENKHNS